MRSILTSYLLIFFRSKPFVLGSSGDPLRELRQREMKKKNMRIDGLEKEVRSLKLQLSNEHD